MTVRDIQPAGAKMSKNALGKRLDAVGCGSPSLPWR
jgi:hypothetical protein